MFVPSRVEIAHIRGLPEQEAELLRIAAQVLARAALSEMPELGRLEVRQLLRHPEARLVIMTNVGTGTAELVAFAPGHKPLRAPLR